MSSNDKYNFNYVMTIVHPSIVHLPFDAGNEYL